MPRLSHRAAANLSRLLKGQEYVRLQVIANPAKLQMAVCSGPEMNPDSALTIN